MGKRERKKYMRRKEKRKKKLPIPKIILAQKFGSIILNKAIT